MIHINHNLFTFTDNQQPNFVTLRNKLWCEIFSFLSVLLNVEKQNSRTESTNQGIVSSILLNGQNEHFVKAVCISIDSKMPQLQKNALKFITSLLSPEDTTIKCNKKQKSSVLTLFDKTKNCEDTENIDPRKSKNIYCATDNRYKETTNENIQLNLCNALDKSYVDTNQALGNVLCNSLLNLYEIQYLENNRDMKKKELVIGALSSLLYASNEAKNFALQEKLLERVLGNLKSLNLELSLHSLEALRISEKKKVRNMFMYIKTGNVFHGLH